VRRIRAFVVILWALLGAVIIGTSIIFVGTEYWGRWSAMLPSLALMDMVLGVACYAWCLVATIVTGREESGVKAELKGRT
jgi:hypothetical protein